MSEEKVKLIEVFNTWQGEGKDCGRSMLILRFKTCNLNCPWCDTKVKMRITPEAEYSIPQLQKILDENKSGILITGGEPTANRHFEDCLMLLVTLNFPVANIETNGYQLEELARLAPKSKNIKFIYSPKIFSPDDRLSAVTLTQKLFLKHNNIYIKVVYEDDNEYLLSYLRWLSKLGEYHQNVYLMPEGVTRADLIKNSAKVFDAAEKYKFNFSSRDHIIYGFI